MLQHGQFWMYFQFHQNKISALSHFTSSAIINMLALFDQSRCSISSQPFICCYWKMHTANEEDNKNRIIIILNYATFILPPIKKNDIIILFSWGSRHIRKVELRKTIKSNNNKMVCLRTLSLQTCFLWIKKHYRSIFYRFSSPRSITHNFSSNDLSWVENWLSHRYNDNLALHSD